MRKVSFKRTLISAFIITSIIPIIVLGIFSSVAILGTLRQNTENLMTNNMAQIDTNLQITLEAYEDTAYQIYTSDDMVSWVRKLDAGEDVPATVNQMRRFMHGLMGTKDYIKAITIITEDGSVVTYDEMTGVTTQRVWIDNFSKTYDEIYDEVSADYKMHLYSTEYGTNFANEDFYLFHLAHRIVDYKKLDDRIGIMILTLDENLLSNIYTNAVEGANEHTFIIDKNNSVISNGENDSLIGTVLDIGDNPKDAYDDFLKMNYPNKKWSYVYSHYDEEYSWTIVTAINDTNLEHTLFIQMILAISTALAILAIAILVAVVITRRLNTSINTVASGMKRAQEGDLSTKIEIDNRMPTEVGTMAFAYNDMIEDLKIADEKEKEANRKQQEAQIAALEAQINPHFLYNTLDTINWMAIEKDEYDISNAINALATTLRYAISKSNARVTVRDEMEWLKKYIFLQQFRLKDKFTCKLNIDPELMDAPIHKLLMQPFIENAIIHGFEGDVVDATLWIEMRKSDKNIVIEIRDNGKGIDAETIEQINRGNIERKDRAHIGMENVITRMRMYYGEEASVYASSTLGEGTVITMNIPYVDNKL